MSGGAAVDDRPLTARRIAELVGGRLEGDGDVTVHGVAPLDRAGEGQLTFLSVSKYAGQLSDCRASVVLVSPALANAPGLVRTRVVVDAPQDALLQLLPLLFRPIPRTTGVDPTSRLGRGVTLGEGVCLGPFVVLGDGASIGDRVQLDAHVVVGKGVRIGDDSHLYPQVTVYAGTSLGARVTVHSGTRIGSDGFGYVFADGVHRKIPHVGRCIVQDDVEIGANSTIDRGSIDDTVIGAGTKIDNLVMIAHNVRIGRLCLVVAQAGIAGSARIGDGCVIGGQAGIQGHHSIGDRARVGGQAGVLGDVPAGETWSGYPARPHRESLRAQAALYRLAGLLKKIEKMVGGGA